MWLWRLFDEIFDRSQLNPPAVTSTEYLLQVNIITFYKIHLMALSDFDKVILI